MNFRPTTFVYRHYKRDNKSQKQNMDVNVWQMLRKTRGTEYLDGIVTALRCFLFTHLWTERMHSGHYLEAKEHASHP